MKHALETPIKDNYSITKVDKMLLTEQQLFMFMLLEAYNILS